MTTIELETIINAPISRCFDLARSIELHLLSTKKTKERVVAGRKSGLVEQDDSITWEAIHFGLKQRLTSKIADLRPPYFFSDKMTKGAFKSLYHEHHFMPDGSGTKMTDRFNYEVPYGIAGRLFDRIILERYLRGFLIERNSLIKTMAEGNEWINILK